MSRDREEKRKKKGELARQLGVSKSEVDEHKSLAERERVTRPAVQLVEQKASGNFLQRLIATNDELVVALFLVEQRRARLIKAFVLGDQRHELGKVVYHRPAHFIAVVFAAEVAPSSLEALRIDGHEIASEALAAAELEKPRAARIDGVAGVTKGAVVSMRGVARVEAKHDFPLEKTVATIAIEI